MNRNNSEDSILRKGLALELELVLPPAAELMSKFERQIMQLFGDDQQDMISSCTTADDHDDDQSAITNVDNKDKTRKRSPSTCDQEQGNPNKNKNKNKKRRYRSIHSLYISTTPIRCRYGSLPL